MLEQYILQEDMTASYHLLRKELQSRGYAFAEYKLGKNLVVEFTSPLQKVWLTRPDRIGYPLNYGLMKEISRNKTLSYMLAKRLKIPVAFTKTVKSDEKIDDDDIRGLITKYKHLVVKPEQASLSNGVTLNLNTVPEVQDAITYARGFKALSDKVLIQEQVDGEEVRFVILEGRSIAALLRRTPRVIGDGKHTIAQLLHLENADRKNITNSMAPYPQLDSSIIKDEYLTSTYIPSQKEVVELSRSTMIKYGASVYNIFDELHPSYLQLAEKLAHNLGGGFLVIDMMVQDYKAAQTTTNTRFNEINSAPVLKLFYSCRDGKNYDIVPELVDAIEKRINL